MQSILYFIFFVMGCFFGSFFTLAIYRIPRKEDILIKHSYCPNCHHKLGFLDLFPIFSYILLRGKCRYCKTKIRPRYLIIELVSGLTFLLVAISFKLDMHTLTIQTMIDLLFYFIYIATLFIIAGIDKEYIKIQKSVVAFGMIIEILYMIYQCTLSHVNVYQYVIYLLCLIVLIIFSIISLNKTMKEYYFIQILFLSLYMIIFNGGIIYILTVIITLLSIALYKINHQQKQKLSIGFYLSVSNIIVIIVTNIVVNYIQ